MINDQTVQYIKHRTSAALYNSFQLPSATACGQLPVKFDLDHDILNRTELKASDDIISMLYTDKSTGIPRMALNAFFRYCT